MMCLDRVRKLREDQGAFEWFLDNICAAVCGVKDTARRKSMEVPSKWMTVQLEAFSLLCLENYNDMLYNQVNNSLTPRQPKWTADGRGRAKNKGWAKEGITRFNELVAMVREDRLTGQPAEKKYMDDKHSEWNKKTSRKLKRKLDALARREANLEEAEDGFSD
jgi:hypothetical protein